MKRLYYIGLLALGLFEIANVYFIMPMPGSQQLDSINVAYFLYAYRWFFRIAFGLMILFGARNAFATRRRWLPVLAAIPVIVVAYFFNFRMTADHMFLQPVHVLFQSKSETVLSDSALVIVVAREGESKAYPIRYIQYHHQVRDTVGGQAVMVTYCNVCRTGRVYEPVVDGNIEEFRLVGMNHFNAMFEDKSTKSWWRQVNGEAVTGTLKGQQLPEIESTQTTLGKFFALHPFGKVMSADHHSINKYDTLARFEKGKSTGSLTKTDTTSWSDKAWVVGVVTDGNSKAYDWNLLKKNRIIHDSIGNTAIAVALASDGQSFGAFERAPGQRFIVRNDSLVSPLGSYDFAGRSFSTDTLKRVAAYQEFWHSWKQFHPNTLIYQ